MRRTAPPVTRETVERFLAYDPETGIFRRRIRSSNAMPGDIAGYRHVSGYWMISVEGYAYMAHNLAWLILHDEFVFRGVDHRDNDRGNNRAGNLRRATGSQNCANRTTAKHNTSGVKGVYFDSPKGKWRAFICKDGRQKCLGRYSDKEQAIAVRQRAFSEAFGEFAKHA